MVDIAVDISCFFGLFELDFGIFDEFFVTEVTHMLGVEHTIIE